MCQFLHNCYIFGQKQKREKERQRDFCWNSIRSFVFECFELESSRTSSSLSNYTTKHQQTAWLHLFSLLFVFKIPLLLGTLLDLFPMKTEVHNSDLTHAGRPRPSESVKSLVTSWSSGQLRFCCCCCCCCCCCLSSGVSLMDVDS